MIKWPFNHWLISTKLEFHTNWYLISISNGNVSTVLNRLLLETYTHNKPNVHTLLQKNKNIMFFEGSQVS